jgi:hypothetical protein
MEVIVNAAASNRERKKKNKRRRGLLGRIVKRIANWWKRRNFYIVQEQDGSQDESQNGIIDVTMEESFDEEQAPEAGKPRHCQNQDIANEDALATVQIQLAPSLVSAIRACALPGASLFKRNRTKDSFQGSLESIDSLAESHWDPDDDSSQVTPIANNVAHPMDFFSEHVEFLRVHTQPRKVEVVWTTPQRLQRRNKEVPICTSVCSNFFP